ncbi:hypothetical protein, partial [Nocardioides pocheonensis]
MKKHKSVAGSAGLFRIRSLVAFRHQSRVARVLSAVAALAIALVFVPTTAFAVHDTGKFELDGNI